MSLPKIVNITNLIARKLFTFILAHIGVILAIIALRTSLANACATLLGEYDTPSVVLKEYEKIY